MKYVEIARQEKETADRSHLFIDGGAGGGGVGCARLKEVVRCLPRDMRLATTRSRVKLQEGVLQGVVQLHDGSLQQGNHYNLCTTAIGTISRFKSKYKIPYIA
jgi:hypothetical protein